MFVRIYFFILILKINKVVCNGFVKSYESKNMYIKCPQNYSTGGHNCACNQLCLFYFADKNQEVSLSVHFKKHICGREKLSDLKISRNKLQVIMQAKEKLQDPNLSNFFINKIWQIYDQLFYTAPLLAVIGFMKEVKQPSPSNIINFVCTPTDSQRQWHWFSHRLNL